MASRRRAPAVAQEKSTAQWIPIASLLTRPPSTAAAATDAPLRDFGMVRVSESLLVDDTLTIIAASKPFPSASLPFADAAWLAPPRDVYTELSARVGQHYDAWHEARVVFAKARSNGVDASYAEVEQRLESLLESLHVADLRDEPAAWLLAAFHLRRRLRYEMPLDGTIETDAWRRVDNLTTRAIQARPVNDPIGWYARYDLAASLADQDRLPDARAAIAPLLAAKPSPCYPRSEPHYRLGSWLLADDHYAEAVAHLRTGLTLAREDGNVNMRQLLAIEWLRASWNARQGEPLFEALTAFTSELRRAEMLDDAFYPAMGNALADAVAALPSVPAHWRLKLPEAAFAVAAQRLGNAALERHDIRAARRAWKELVRLAPTSEPAAEARRALAEHPAAVPSEETVKARIAALVRYCDEDERAPQKQSLTLISLRQSGARRSQVQGEVADSPYATCLERWAQRYLADAVSLRVVIAYEHYR